MRLSVTRFSGNIIVPLSCAPDDEQNVHFVRYRTLRHSLFFHVWPFKLTPESEQMSIFIRLFIKVHAQKSTAIGRAAAGACPECW